MRYFCHHEIDSDSNYTEGLYADLCSIYSIYDQSVGGEGAVGTVGSTKQGCHAGRTFVIVSRSSVH